MGKNQRKREGQARTCKPNHQECDHRWSRQYDVSTFLAPPSIDYWLHPHHPHFYGFHPLPVACPLLRVFPSKLSPFQSIPSGNLWRWSIDGGNAWSMSRPMFHCVALRGNCVALRGTAPQDPFLGPQRTFAIAPVAPSAMAALLGCSQCGRWAGSLVQPEEGVVCWVVVPCVPRSSYIGDFPIKRGMVIH